MRSRTTTWSVPGAFERVLKFTLALQHIDGVPVEPLALHPQTGGPKNLPVVNAYLSDIEDEESVELKAKPHLVIVGGGWGVSGS